MIDFLTTIGVIIIKQKVMIEAQALCVLCGFSAPSAPACHCVGEDTAGGVSAFYPKPDVH